MKFLVTFIATLIVILALICELAVPIFITFLILRLCEVIMWSWFLVFLPLIIGAIALIIMVVIRIIAEL